MTHTNSGSRRAGAGATAFTALLFLLGCGGATDPSDHETPPTDPRTIAATSSLAFLPASLTIAAGDTVTFEFGSVAHDVFFDAQSGAPDDITGSNANVSIRRVFATAGTYTYTCHIHPFMHGTVVVQSPPAGDVSISH